MDRLQEKDPAARKKLMHRHMQMMRNGMKMMTMMGGASGKPMDDRMEMMEKNGLVIAGVHPKGNLVELIEIIGHPWFVGCQFHPEFKSKPDRVHPLFREFVKTAEHNKMGIEKDCNRKVKTC